MSQPDYSFLDRLLHRMALGSPRMGRIWFDLENSKAERATQPAIDRPVLIAGMARSGSTILLNALYDTGQFRSLNYRDMPFIMMAGTWQGLAIGNQQQAQRKERAHGDRLLVDYDSPEAFEEVFWRTFHGDAYIFDDRVVVHDVPADVQAKYRQFMAHVLISGNGQRRYLAKNNNNLLRLPSLRQAVGDAILLIPFREPLQQALSLRRQHELFLEKHAQDRFSMQYMNWLGHYEFGLGHKRYEYGDASNPYAPETLDYWLFCWRDAYEHALANVPEGAVFIGYEQLCAEPLDGFTRLLPRLSIDVDPAKAASFYSAAEARPAEGYDAALYESCLETQGKLLQRHLA